MKYYLGIIGSRRRNSPEDKELVRKALLMLIDTEGRPVLISGGCPKGADRFAEELAKELNLDIIIHYPDLSGCVTKNDFRREYYRRNLLVAANADVLIACVASDRKGGTEHTIKNYLKKKENLILV